MFDFGGRGRGLGRTKRPPGAPLERSVGHDGRMECHQAFSIEFSNYAHYDRHIDTCRVVSRLVVILAALFRVCWCFLRVAGVLDPSTREYGTCGTRIGLARRGARALLDCHDGKDDG